MGQINIYRIQPQKTDSFFQKVGTDYSGPKSKNIEKDSVLYTFSFFHKDKTPSKDISWAWVFDEYELDSPKANGGPKGIIVVTAGKEHPIYAITFGTAFFSVDKYCDKDFGFDYACRVPYSNIKLTALTNPVSVRNKTINSYQNYDKLDFSSGESFAKIKGKTLMPSDDDYLKDTIEVGTAIKFQLKKDSFDNIIKLIVHIESILRKEKQTSIPRFCLVRDKDRIERLQNNLVIAIKKQLPQVLLSEFWIIGSSEVFNRSDVYRLSYKQEKREYSELTLQNIIDFCNENNISDAGEIINVKVHYIEDGVSRNSSSLLSVLDFMDEEEKCLLEHGDWFEFNDDYLSYLQGSLEEIPVYYQAKYDLSSPKLETFIKKKYEQERCEEKYSGMQKEEIETLIRKKYYPEYAFNAMRAESMEDHFILGDRKTFPIGNASIEIADLFSDDTIFSVKRGSSSADFSYVAEQSSMALNAYKHGEIPQVKNIKKMVIWLILIRKTPLPMIGKTLDWEKLNMLVLKNRLDQWKKEVRLAGLQPEIWINYHKED